MARKQTITKEMILQGAFALAQEQGLEAVTARKVAAKANCSTQPIFRSYENMEDLIGDVIERAGDYFAAYYELAPRTNPVPFVDLGMAYIGFAREHEMLFRILFVSHTQKKVSTYELINGGEKMYVLKELRRLEGVTPQAAGQVFSDFWTFVHGLACMALNGDLDLTEEEVARNLASILEKLKK